MRVVAAVVATLVVAPALVARSAGPHDVDPRNISGTWVLNTWLSDPGDQIAQEIRADLGPPNLFDISGAPDRGRIIVRDALGTPREVERGGSASKRPLLNADDNQRIKSLLDVVQLPATTLTISQSTDGITIADPVRGMRTFATNGSRQKQAFDSGTLDATTRWEGPQLLTDYDARHGVAVRFAYMAVPPDNHLLVRISVRMPGEDVAPYVIRHVYDRTPASGETE